MGDIHGYADQVYARRGQRVTLYVSTPARGFRVEAFRMGYYQGTGARQVWRSAETPGRRQPACPVERSTHMVSCTNWSPSLGFTLTRAFVPGDYLLKLVGNGGQQSYVPLTVWDPSSHATYVVKNDVFTWQAWNPYGGYDFYSGVGSCSGGYPLCSRARVTSYDRPYGYRQGAGDFLGNELPLVRFVEQHGLDVTYATDLTLQQHPRYLLSHRALLSLGHDECWSLGERQAAVAAQGHGVNILFFAASAVLRHVRTQSSPRGADRELVDYRDSAQDPREGSGDPRQVTGNTWASPPASWPEDRFVGESYAGFLEPGRTIGFHVVDASAWPFRGANLRDGSVLPDVIASDVDRLDTAAGHPADVEVLAHSAIPANEGQTSLGDFYSDMTYYTDATSHAGVIDTGTNNWIPALMPSDGWDPINPSCDTPGVSCSYASVQRITGNLLQAFGRGPAGDRFPSVANWQSVYH